MSFRVREARAAHHAGLRAAEDRTTDLLDSCLEPPCERVYARELREVVCERVRARRGEDACLTHAAAEELAEPARLRDEFLRADENRTDRCACIRARI